MSRPRRCPVAILGCLLVFCAPLAHLRAEYPLMERLDRSDPLYLQHQNDIQHYYRSASAGDELPPLLIYRYDLQEHDTLFAVAARLSMPYSAIASLNRLTGPSFDERSSILIPGIPGIYLPLDPASDLEMIMHDLRRDRPADVLSLALQDGRRAYRFYPGEDFLAEERTAFLGMTFRHPLPNGRLTSPYGPRINPITARYTFHGGADYAAPAGTPVLAARGGRVSHTGSDEILGIYIIVDHSGGFQTLYGHLKSMHVSLNDEVRSGMILGRVGSTGQVTGSHLHFEIRHNGRTRDPETMVRQDRR